MVMVSECGGVASLPKPTRLPIMRQPTRPAMPALMWTTVPPAKSSAPHAPQQAVVGRSVRQEVRSGPVPHHVRDREIETTVSHSTTKIMSAREADAFGKGPDDQRRRDAREGHLEDHERYSGR
jgi:hypothetical protein